MRVWRRAGGMPDGCPHTINRTMQLCTACAARHDNLHTCEQLLVSMHSKQCVHLCACINAHEHVHMHLTACMHSACMHMCACGCVQCLHNHACATYMVECQGAHASIVCVPNYLPFCSVGVDQQHGFGDSFVHPCPESFGVGHISSAVLLRIDGLYVLAANIEPAMHIALWFD